MIKNLEQILRSKNPDWYRNLFNNFYSHLEENKPERIIKNDAGKLPAWDNNKLRAIVIRNNEYYNTNDIIRNNDFIILVHEKSEEQFDIYFHRATADPKTRKTGIANAIEQIYSGNIRSHNWGLTGDRPAICQDKCDTWVRRYNKTKTSKYKYYDANNGYYYYEERDKFTIHLHNPWKYWNSSLGCGIAETNRFVDDMKVLRKLVPNDNIPVMWINDDTLSKITDIDESEILIHSSHDGRLAIIKKFQSDNNLDPDGRVGPKTISKVNLVTTHIVSNSTEATKAIIQTFQLDNGLDPDGKVGPKTIAKINELKLKA